MVDFLIRKWGEGAFVVHMHLLGQCYPAWYCCNQIFMDCSWNRWEFSKRLQIFLKCFLARVFFTHAFVPFVKRPLPNCNDIVCSTRYASVKYKCSQQNWTKHNKNVVWTRNFPSPPHCIPCIFPCIDPLHPTLPIFPFQLTSLSYYFWPGAMLALIQRMNNSVINSCKKSFSNISLNVEFTHFGNNPFFTSCG